MRWLVAGIALVVTAGCGDNFQCDWRQWGNGGAHAGDACSSGQPLATALDDIVYDPFTDGEETDAGGDLVIHYQAPLLAGNDVFMMTKTGTYTPCDVGSQGPECFNPDELYRLNSQVWTEQRFERDHGKLVRRWSYDSDWKPEPEVGFEPMFQPALAGATIAIPGAGGSLRLLDQASGDLVRHVEPFGTDPDTYVAGGVAVGDDGTIYYNAIQLDHALPFAMPSHAWLVAVAADGTTRMADYADLVPGAPALTDPCYRTFDPMMTPRPWPPPPNPDGTPVLPPVAPCGPQRPGINSTPAIGADGTIFVVTHADFNERYSYVVAVAPDLSPKWATSLRDYLHDGCGVTVPSDGTPTQHIFHCRAGAPVGVEPSTGLPPAALVDDSSSSSPVALPDGGVLYGALTGYNGSRGHLVSLDAAGVIRASYDFGWDTTPAIVGSGSTYKIVLKDNHYGQDANGVDLGPYYITELDASLQVVWQLRSTETESCQRQPDGTIACVASHPNGFEWCINAPAVDRDGVVFANSEDGHLYAIAPDGTQRDRFFLDRALGAAYTPLALDYAGRVYSLNNGHLVVVGRN